MTYPVRTPPLMFSLFFLCGSLLASETAKSKAEKNLNPQIASLGDNTWLKMSPPKEPDGRNYSGCFWGDWGKGGRVFYYGGGHFSYSGNDVAIYDIASNVWSRSYEPEMDPGKSDQPLSKLGRPWPLHSYQQICWVPERNVLFHISLAQGTWQFDPAKMEWTCLNGKYQKDEKKQFSPATPYGHQTMHCFYSPELKAPVVHLTSQPFGNYKYVFEKQEWIKMKGGIPEKHKWAEPYSTYIASLGVQLIAQREAPYFWIYNAVNEEWKEFLGEVPNELRGAKDKCGCEALAWDSANKVVVAMVKPGPEGKVTPWVLDPATMKWTEQKPANEGPFSRTDGGTWASLCYDPDNNLFFFLNRTGQTGCESWIYRFKRAAEKK